MLSATNDAHTPVSYVFVDRPDRLGGGWQLTLRLPQGVVRTVVLPDEMTPSPPESTLETDRAESDDVGVDSQDHAIERARPMCVARIVDEVRSVAPDVADDIDEAFEDGGFDEASKLIRSLVLIGAERRSERNH